MLGEDPMKRHVVPAFLLALAVGTNAACAQDGDDDVQNGHRLANLICSNCHVASSDQPFRPILQPSAPSFDSIAQRSTVDSEFISTFLTTTHRDISSPNGMPNPQLLDYQVKQIAAYLLSLRKAAAAPTTICGREIAKLEQVLSQVRATRGAVASAPETNAARLHRQPTPESVARAEDKAEQTIEATLVTARKLDASGKQDECLATLKAVALQLGVP
jgi:mono/diheme cytochrome c family protein